MEYIIKTINLTKAFKGIEVIKSVNIRVKKGEIYGLLGPNGAGKTTLMRIITGLIKSTAGEVEVFGDLMGNNSYESLKRLGAIIEYPVFYDKLTARENLKIHCEYMGYHDEKEIDKVLTLVKLPGNNSKKVKEFSLGMKQRLGIARAMVTKPELLILDEPINGLDPEGIREIRDLLKLLNKEYGITILISSHILSEIEQIADTIGVVSEGRVIKEVSMNDIKEMNTQYIEIETENYKKAGYILENNLGIRNFKIVDENKIRIYDSQALKNEISKELIMNDVEINSITKKSSSLEDYFLKLTKGDGINA
ncbi:ABC transporter ATP-binding protein [Clostridium amazonitimonense]|uniref:ABC transporter ATP-binding protein n=1 Tax=Clostridium amazonitimonense TaxID=1499689 RepID=UPI000509C0C7|nr:ABC transporter ATP-binding protein [Clostridium amazonitimonense]